MNVPKAHSTLGPDCCPPFFLDCILPNFMYDLLLGIILGLVLKKFLKVTLPDFYSRKLRTQLIHTKYMKILGGVNGNAGINPKCYCHIARNQYI